MVGIGTVLSDDPSLTVKSEERRKKRVSSGLPENPLRVVVDSFARTPTNAEILRKGEGKRLVAVSTRAPSHRVEELKGLRDVEVVVTGDSRVDLRKLMEILWDRGIRRLMVEGGGTLNWSLFYEGLVDEYITYVGNVIIGGEKAPTPVDGEGFVKGISLELIGSERLGEGVILRWRVMR
jgi:2,5-diamino-6-(ribosylamino)-4(3H)-pyrimidinone 5'-phosphate reductase